MEKANNDEAEQQLLIEEFKTTYQQTDISNVSTSDSFCGEDTIITDEFPNPNPYRITLLNSVYALLLHNQSLGRASNLSHGSTGGDAICRICFGGPSAERLVKPCACRGTIAFVHRNCLERWLLQASTSYCELCGHHYAVVRTHKWSFFRSLREWVKSAGGKAFAADLWRAAALGTTSVLETARALQACEKLQQVGVRRGGGVAVLANIVSSVMIGVIGALNGLLASWILLKIQEHQSSWQTWRDSTLHLRVMLPGDDLTSPPPCGTPTPDNVQEDGVRVERSADLMSIFPDMQFPLN